VTGPLSVHNKRVNVPAESGIRDWGGDRCKLTVSREEKRRKQKKATAAEQAWQRGFGAAVLLSAGKEAAIQQKSKRAGYRDAATVAECTCSRLIPVQRLGQRVWCASGGGVRVAGQRQRHQG
jgi:hypothetical protein